ncbi:hypothetical protein GX408_11320 [bacterium]|nr:hypothetical protein [bacterium]
MKEKINRLRQRKGKYQKRQSQLDSSNEGQISQTAPDSRIMQSRNGKDVGYHVQRGTDNKHKLIAAHAVADELTDLHSCYQCRQKSKCARARSPRRIYRWEYEEVLEQLDHRIKDKSRIINDRKAMV